MKSTLYPSLNISNARNWRNALADEAASNIYLYLGKDTVWTNENDPDEFDASSDSKVITKENMLVLIRLAFDDTCLAIPRIDWEINTVYPQYDRTNDKEDIYVMTGLNNVYKVISNNDGAESTSPPIGQSTNNIIGADGYIWKFMFNIPTTIADTFLTDEFIPVPSGTQKSDEQLNVEAAAVLTDGSPPQGHGFSSSTELIAKHVIISKKILFSDIDLTFEHRQFGLVSGPKDVDAVALSDDIIVIDPDIVDIYSGNILTVTNHQVVTSSEEETEIVQLVLSF